MNSIDRIYSGFRPRETKCLLCVRNTRAVMRAQVAALLLCHKKQKHSWMSTNWGEIQPDGEFLQHCHLVQHAAHSPWSLLRSGNGWKVCRHTFCLLITQISLGDGIPWQDGWGVLCWKWIGLAQERQPERKTFEVLLLHQFIHNARTSYLHYSSRERKGNVNKFGLSLWLIGI